MGRAPCCEKVGLKRGRWTAEEDEILLKYIEANGEGSWRALPKNAGLLRCGKSCRLRWINYLRADLKRGNISSQEEDLIIKLHNSMGNKWSLIAGNLPGRTDNEIKNYWNSHLSRRIHSFRRPNCSNTVNEAHPLVVMDLAKMSKNNNDNGFKPKGGRKSRAAMKKKNNYTPSPNALKKPKLDQKTTEKSGCEGDVMTLISTQEKETQMSGLLEQVEERESMILDSYEDGEERDSLVIPGGPCHDGGGILGHHSSVERESIMLCPNEEIESGLLGSPYVAAAGILCPNDIIMGNEMMGANGVSTFNEERENGVMGFSEYQDGLEVLMDSNKGSTSDQGSSNGVLNSNNASDQWYSSAVSSSFEDEWANWDFDLGNVTQDLKVWDERDELLSWLWESDHNDHGGVETTKVESEKQKALADWLLS